MGGNVSKINPIAQSHLVIDHSVQVDYYGMPGAMAKNTEIEMQRNHERYEFLKWGMEIYKLLFNSLGTMAKLNLLNPFMN
jgi:aconitate hydratase